MNLPPGRRVRCDPVFRVISVISGQLPRERFSISVRPERPRVFAKRMKTVAVIDSVDADIIASSFELVARLGELHFLASVAQSAGTPFEDLQAAGASVIRRIEHVRSEEHTSELQSRL